MRHLMPEPPHYKDVTLQLRVMTRLTCFQPPHHWVLLAELPTVTRLKVVMSRSSVQSVISVTAITEICHILYCFL